MATKPQVSPEAQAWIDRIADYEREFKTWEGRANKIVKVFRDYDSTADKRSDTASFNILWSNIQVLLPATFARLPKPDVSRRFRDNDPVGRVAALILERALSYEIEHYPDYRSAMELSVLDRFLGGRGTSWVRYEPHIEAAVQITEDADADQEGEADEEIKYECAPVDYVHWKDFGHTVARTWEEVTAVWRKVYLDRRALEKRFGDEGKTVPLDCKPDTNMSGSKENVKSQACIYEIWDKESGSAIWLSKSLGKVLDQKPDPLKLANFFPCPRPLFATITSDSLIPVPDYKQYQDQAAQLNKLSQKIDGLIDQLKVFGVYDSATQELARLFKEAGNGDLIPVKNFAAFAEKNGLKGTIDLFDIAPIVSALNEAYTAQERIKNEVYELVGISDITRGASDPTETYGAQKLKGQYGNMRLRDKQAKVVNYATEILQIKAQVMCQHFQPETLAKISSVEQLQPEDQQYVMPAMQLLMGTRAVDPMADTEEGPLSNFRVEVSSDSMVQMDEQQEKADRVEFLGGVSSFLQQAVPAIQSTPQIAPLLAGLLKFAVSGFKVGKTVEGMIDNAIDQLTKEAANPQPKPDPEMAKVEAQVQLEQMKAQIQAEQAERDAERDMKVAQYEQQVQAQQNAHQNELEAMRAQQQAELEARLEEMRVQSEAALQAREQASQERMNALDNQVKVLIAKLGAETTEKTAQMAAERPQGGE